MNAREVLLNDFAIRSFRDTGDQDYIAARLSFRSRLIPQFLWQSLQALEKYLKCVLVLNRIPAKRGHDLGELILAFERARPFELRLSQPCRKFIGFLDAYGRHRYFESSWYVKGGEIVELDRSVWEVRRYARVLQYELQGSEGSQISALPIEIGRNVDAESRHPQDFVISGGLLESIIGKKQHPAREALIWQNGFYGKSHRSTVRLRSGLQAANSPLTLHPELLDDVLNYVFIPKDVVDAYRNAR